MNNLIRDFNEKVNIDEIVCTHCQRIFNNQYEYNAHMVETDCFCFKNDICRSCFKSNYQLKERLRKTEDELREKKKYITILENALINPNAKTQNRRISIPNSVRQKLWINYFKESLKGYCMCCGKEITYHDYHISHKIAVSRGGDNSIDNLTICCSSCNMSMKDMNFFQFKELFYPIK